MKRVLVVDDMAICREPIADALQGHGYSVACAASGEEALAALREQRPDVVLLDMAMPGMDGLAVLRTIRRSRDWRSLPVIMLTDRAERECIVGAASLNIQGYVLKSGFSLSDLLDRVSACLDGPVATAESAASDEASQSECDVPGASPGKVSLVRPTARSTTTRSLSRTARDTKLAASGAPAQEQCISLQDLTPIVSESELARIVREGLDLRPLGATVHNVIAATSAPGCSAADVGKAVTRDQALSIRVLKIANSSAYSRGRPVDGVKEAVQRIGIQEVRRMVMALGIVQQYEEAAGKHVDARLFWEHSTACGLIAAAVAETRRAENPDEYFLSGMLHDIGRLILFEHAPEPYAQVWETAERLDLPLETVESRLMLVDHCGVLGRALAYWQFPEEFITPVVNHHRPLGAIRRLGARYGEAAAIVAFANRLAHALLLGSSGNDVAYPLDEFAALLSLTPPLVTEIASRVVDETRDLKHSMLARASGMGWPEVPTQVRQRIGMPLRPLFVSSGSAVDVVRILVDQIADRCDDGGPNIAIVSQRKSDELSHMIAKLETEERKSAVGRLPILIITSQEDTTTHHALLRSRQSSVIRMPMRITTFASAVAALFANAPAPSQ